MGGGGGGREGQAITKSHAPRVLRVSPEKLVVIQPKHTQRDVKLSED